MISLPLMIKIALLTIVALVLAKAFAPTVGQAIWDFIYKPKKKRNSDLDFDFLIEQKKSMLRGGQASPTGATVGNSTQKSATEIMVHETYKKLSSMSKKSKADELKYQELKKFMTLLDTIQWGGGKDFQELATQLTNKMAKKVTEADINQSFQALLRREVFISSTNQLLSFENIIIILETNIFFQHLLQDDQLQKSLSIRYSTGINEIKKGLAVYFKKAQRKGTDKLQVSILKSTAPQLPPLDSPFLYGLLKDKKDIPYKRVEILAQIRDEVEFFKTLSPLPKLKGKSDIEGAYLILGLKKGASLEQVKKQYKSLAKEKHPDRLKGKGIPSEFESIATENFTRIQDAYDILSSELKN